MNPSASNHSIRSRSSTPNDTICSSSNHTTRSFISNQTISSSPTNADIGSPPWNDTIRPNTSHGIICWGMWRIIYLFSLLKLCAQMYTNVILVWNRDHRSDRTHHKWRMTAWHRFRQFWTYTELPRSRSLALQWMWWWHWIKGCRIINIDLVRDRLIGGKDERARPRAVQHTFSWKAYDEELLLCFFLMCFNYLCVWVYIYFLICLCGLIVVCRCVKLGVHWFLFYFVLRYSYIN